MPTQRPGTSEQVVCTPPAFIRACEARFGRFGFDLAATPENSIVPGQHYGPGSLFYAEDALRADWKANLGDHSVLGWLNPEYGMIKGPHGFAAKARREGAKGVRLVMLIPAAVATNWFADEIHGHALVIPIRPRLTFVGHKDPYPKDLMICAYNLGTPGFEPWRWA